MCTVHRVLYCRYDDYIQLVLCIIFSANIKYCLIHCCYSVHDRMYTLHIIMTSQCTVTLYWSGIALMISNLKIILA